MSHILGVHLIPIHNRNGDYDYIRALQPGSVKIVDPDVTHIHRVYEAAPDALIVLRDHPLSEQHNDMHRDPEGTGKRHARRWNDKWFEYQMQAAQRGMLMPSRDNVIVLGINEPRVWDALSETARYTVAFLDECTSLGLRAGALNLSVGWPDNTGPDTPANWEPYAPVEPSIKRGRHFLFLHEYHDERGVNHNWRWWCGRYEHCPWDVPIIIGECGLDKGVATADFETHKRGWRGWYDSARYADELFKYAELCAQDGRIHSIEPFTTDGAREWQSFDTEPAHGEILSREWPKVGEHTVLIPDVTVGQPKLLYVTATAGLNVRKEPTTDSEILNRLPHGTAVEVSVKRGDWWSVSGGWVHGAWLSETKPEPVPTPEPVPSRECWARAYPWVLKWEGGWADHPSDPGGATMKGITIGTYARWREAQGQPKPTKNDLRNISDAEVEAIYREWYWKASGADKLPWPLCLAVFDTAVNGGVGRATDILARSNGDFLRYMGILIDWYTRINNFETFGRAWIRRRAEILLEAAK